MNLVFQAVQFGGVKFDIMTVMLGIIGALLIILALRYVLMTFGIMTEIDGCTEDELRSLWKRRNAATGFERDYLSRKYNRAWSKTQFKDDCK